MIESSMWVLRIKPVASGRAALTLKLGDISIGPVFFNGEAKVALVGLRK